MARVKAEINKDELQKVISDLEATQTFTNLSALFKAVEATDWAKKQQPKPLTASVVYLRVREFKLTLKTVAGKKGRELGSLPRGTRVPRSQKMKRFAKSFELMNKETPDRYKPLVLKAAQGSLKAAIKLKCLECSAWESTEVKRCELAGCSLFPIRPFQGKVEEENDASS